MRQIYSEINVLTGFKLREMISVLVSYTVDPLRNRQTNSQHIPKGYTGIYKRDKHKTVQRTLICEDLELTIVSQCPSMCSLSF